MYYLFVCMFNYHTLGKGVLNKTLTFQTASYRQIVMLCRRQNQKTALLSQNQTDTTKVLLKYISNLWKGFNNEKDGLLRQF